MTKIFLLVTPTKEGLRIEKESSDTTELYREMDFFQSQNVIEKDQFDVVNKSYQKLECLTN